MIFTMRVRIINLVNVIHVGISPIHDTAAGFSLENFRGGKKERGGSEHMFIFDILSTGRKR